jgi:hypothetical protein
MCTFVQASAYCANNLSSVIDRPVSRVGSISSGLDFEWARFRVGSISSGLTEPYTCTAQVQVSKDDFRCKLRTQALAAADLSGEGRPLGKRDVTVRVSSSFAVRRSSSNSIAPLPSDCSCRQPRAHKAGLAPPGPIDRSNRTGLLTQKCLQSQILRTFCLGIRILSKTYAPAG